MENSKEGGSINRPPILDGTNDDYWKARMVAFLKSIDNKTWKAIVKGWKHPVKADKEGTSTTELKPEEEWNKEEDEEALGNSKALNAIFNGVDKNMFRLINTCTVAKDAWEILKVAHEGTSRVRMSRLQLLTTQFENLRKKEEKTISDFHMRVRDLANASFALGEQMSEEKLARKILRSLPKKCDMKVTAIEEAQDISSIKVDELIGSLQTFEMSINERSDKKNKSITFVSNAEDDDQSEKDADENIAEALALLRKKFSKVMWKFDRRSKPNTSDKRFDTANNFVNSRRGKEEDKTGRGKGIQCHECEGFGHIKAECPTYLKKQSKGMVATWSDDDSGEEGETQVLGFTMRCSSENGSSDDDISEEELAETYRLLFNKWEEACNHGKKLELTVAGLEADKKRLKDMNKNLQEEISVLKSRHEEMIKSVRMLNRRSDVLDQILETGKMAKDMKGIGYGLEPTSEEGSKYENKFVPLEKRTEFKVTNQMFQQGVKHVYPQVRSGRNSSWRCHHFDSGCSRHMIGVKNLLDKVKPHTTSYVTFGDGAKGKIKGSGKLVSSGSPGLDDVLLVEGLTANLISISQLCDQDLDVSFNKTACRVTDSNGEVVMRGTRSKDNCYMWASQDKAMSSKCLSTVKEEVILWHQKLGHSNPKGMKMIISTEGIRGLPKLKIKEDRICGECQVGKQTKASHKKLQQVPTSKTLELLHMDLMGPMQVESLGGKRYAFVCVDDFSRYTWVNFIAEKSDTFSVFKELCQQIQREKGYAEAEYIAAGSGCTQLIWMKQMLKEYNILQDIMTLYCDNLSAINISQNPIQHSRTKHIDIWHYFIRELVEEKVILLEHVDTEAQLADIFTKALDAVKFEKLRSELGVCMSTEL
ncbi:uncharacterized protein LOC130744244 [Lotus japonicus]|uniref:uncharacterized protein LOC130744244 n=1 Tax=Lotus japonicus TaxID=34305 RepID=UPI00258862AB|nr:uncharacterized protein LOC130744244 [Lotus japonicus]